MGWVSHIGGVWGPPWCCHVHSWALGGWGGEGSIMPNLKLGPLPASCLPRLPACPPPPPTHTEAAVRCTVEVVMAAVNQGLLNNNTHEEQQRQLAVLQAVAAVCPAHF